jgi:Rrf2 family protein
MFSQTSEYALRAMICLASLEKAGADTASNERIAQLSRIPAGYLSKVMRALVVGGLVESQRGPRGGFSLVRTPEAITLLDIVRTVDADPTWRRESDMAPDMPETPLRKRLHELTRVLQENLRASTLAQVLADVDDSRADAA